MRKEHPLAPGTQPEDGTAGRGLTANTLVRPVEHEVRRLYLLPRLQFVDPADLVRRL